MSHFRSEILLSLSKLRINTVQIRHVQSQAKSRTGKSLRHHGVFSIIVFCALDLHQVIEHLSLMTYKWNVQMTSVWDTLPKYVVFFIAELHGAFCAAIFRKSCYGKMQKLASLSTPFQKAEGSPLIVLAASSFSTHHSETKSCNHATILALLILSDKILCLRWPKRDLPQAWCCGCGIQSFTVGAGFLLLL